MLLYPISRAMNEIGACLGRRIMSQPDRKKRTNNNKRKAYANAEMNLITSD